MNRVRRCAFFGVVLLLAAGSGCLEDAPRDSPFDPESDRFREEGTVSGQVMNRAAQPLDAVEVRLIPPPGAALPELVTRTDGQGRFLFSGAPAGSNYTLQALKENYAAEEVAPLDIRAGFSQELPVLHLNALPVFTRITLHTLHISRWWPENDLFFLEAEADVEDADGLLDIDRVWFELPDLGLEGTLEAEAAGRFSTLVAADTLPVPSLQALLGRPFHLNVRDREGVVTGSLPQQLTRIIDGTPVADSPQGLVLLSTDLPTLVWEPFPPAFNFTYRVDVFRDEVNRPVRVLSKEGIGMGVTSLQLETPLPTGPYFWTVTVVDGFGNQSRSKEAGFRIP